MFIRIELYILENKNILFYSIVKLLKKIFRNEILPVIT